MKENKNDLTPADYEINRTKQNHEADSRQAQELRELFSNSFFLGEILNPDGYANIRADCGDSIEVFLKIKDNCIQKARFDTLGCGFTIACGNKAMEMAEGRTLSEAQLITPEKIVQALGNYLPPSHIHCAELASETLKKAIIDYYMHQKDSLKR